MVKGLFLKEREGHPPPRIVETPVGHAERDRPAGHRRAPVRPREDAGTAAPRRGGHRQRLRQLDRRARRGLAHPVRRARAWRRSS
ncbi:MAG: hypothetical protein MZU84_04505 [Sphingobacterium sp.]|nr:hypothetical protein [Sphingobacterium sp.]